MRRIVLGGLLALGVAATASAQGSAGDWKVTGMIGDNAINITCAMKTEDKKLTGTCKDQMFPNLVVTGETDGKTAKWSYEVDFQGMKLVVEYAGTAESPTSWKGNISVMGQQMGTYTATKQ